ncbi:MAG TPA: glycogen debranching protein GlgX, partial [Novosphingobium sp.]|nr:glycogen debranching protein GlgX [Novosphingobium sp.]
TETRLPMTHGGDGWWRAELPGACKQLAYGFRAQGEWAPERGCWFDPAKLLVDPYARVLDRRFTQSPMLAARGVETGAIVPRALLPGDMPQVPLAAPLFTPGGLIYEVPVRGFTMLHPDVPEAQRGTVAALAHPAVIAHLRRLHVSAVELMPIIAWVDERHLPPLGLGNAWGYNPVAMMALDPGLCPGGVAELRETVAALHAAGIGVLLDIVLNHTGESDVQGGLLSLRGLDDSAYAKAGDGTLINDTGCGNTLDFAQPHVRALALAALRHFVAHCGVDGFRFDLATVLARGPGFAADAPFFAELAADPWLASRVMIAEPWDIGPGGYQLGRFPAHWLEWNDRWRDDVRRFWKGEAGLGELATRLAGSADIFGEQACRSVNFLAAHDGFTLADTLAYARRHNEANGEQNRDGHGQNHSWNHGAEGPSDDPAILAARAASARAMLGTLFASTGTIMLTAGDEFGRSQQGNNNAYCQDNATSWVDWARRDLALEAHVVQLAATRARWQRQMAQFPRSGAWQRLDGAPMRGADWEGQGSPGFAFLSHDAERPQGFCVDRAARQVALQLPPGP